MQLLNSLRNGLEKESVEYFVIGGIAVDGLKGDFHRDHGDVDLLVWEKDAMKVQNIIMKECQFNSSNYGHKLAVVASKGEEVIGAIFINKENEKVRLRFKEDKPPLLPLDFFGRFIVDIKGVKFNIVNPQLLYILKKRFVNFFDKKNRFNEQRGQEDLDIVKEYLINRNIDINRLNSYIENNTH